MDFFDSYKEANSFLEDLSSGKGVERLKAAGEWDVSINAIQDKSLLVDFIQEVEEEFRG